MTNQVPPPPPPAATPEPSNVLPRHPDSQVVLVLGVISVVLCQILGPIAWILGNRAVRDFRVNPGAWSGENEARVGRILGIIGTVLLLVTFVVFLIGMFFIIANTPDFDGTAI